MISIKWAYQERYCLSYWITPQWWLVIEDALTRAWVHIRLGVMKREIDFQSMSIVHPHLPNTIPDKKKILIMTATAGASPDPWVLFLDDCFTLVRLFLSFFIFYVYVQTFGLWQTSKYYTYISIPAWLLPFITPFLRCLAAHNLRPLGFTLLNHFLRCHLIA